MRVKWSQLFIEGRLLLVVLAFSWTRSSKFTLKIYLRLFNIINTVLVFELTWFTRNKTGISWWRYLATLLASRKILFQKYTLMNASVKKKNGKQILESSLKSVSTMLTRKIKAVKVRNRFYSVSPPSFGKQ